MEEACLCWLPEAGQADSVSCLEMVSVVLSMTISVVSVVLSAAAAASAAIAAQGQQRGSLMGVRLESDPASGTPREAILDVRLDYAMEEACLC